MEKIKQMPWLNDVRTQRFEGVAPAGFKDDINDYCNKYKEKYGRYLSMTDVIIMTMSHFLATNTISTPKPKKAAAPKKASKKAVKKNRLKGKAIKTAS